MLSATAGSPICACQFATGAREVPLRILGVVIRTRSHAQNDTVRRALCSLESQFLLITALGVTLKPWRSALPLRRKSKSITIRHLDLRQTLGVHYLVFLDYVALVQEEGG